MFHFRRKQKTKSYWYLSDSFDDDSMPDDHIGEWSLPEKNCSTTSSSMSSPSLEHAMELQNKWTSWPNTIWEMNVDDAEVEIVFCDDDNDEEPMMHNREFSSKRSEGTVDTASSCSSPELHQSGWDLDDLDLSVIMEDEDDDHDVVASEQGLFLDHPLSPERGSTTSSTSAIREDVLVTDSTVRQAFGSPISSSSSLDHSNSHSHSHYFLIQDSLEDAGHHYQQQSPALMLPKAKRRKHLRFADEEGMDIETVHVVDCDDYVDPKCRRVLVLLLLPQKRTYEFVHAEYDTDTQLTILELLLKLPTLASDRHITRQQFSGLCRAVDGKELINAMSIQSFDLSEDEILIGILRGYKAEAMCDMARELVENEKIVRAVKKTKKGCHALHLLEDSDDGCVLPVEEQSHTGIDGSGKESKGRAGKGDEEASKARAATSGSQQGLFRRRLQKGANSKKILPQEKPIGLFSKAIFPQGRSRVSNQSSTNSRESKQQQKPTRAKDAHYISANDSYEKTKKTMLQFLAPKISKLQASHRCSESVSAELRKGEDSTSEAGGNRTFLKRRWGELKSATRKAVYG